MSSLNEDGPAFTLEVRPSLPSPPPVLLVRNRGGFPKVVMQEDEAFELYLVLKAYFEGDHDA